MTNYQNKKFSILGDSISTFEGFCPKGYRIFYDDRNQKVANISSVEDTWWMKVINHFDGQLLVNNSWSGSCVTWHKPIPTFPSGASKERTFGLHTKDALPDVIIVYLGFNDWARGINSGIDTTLIWDDSVSFFTAYDLMIKQIRNNYPNSEIWCCTLPKTFISSQPLFTFPENHAGVYIEDYNMVISSIVSRYNCRLIDLYKYKQPYDSIDGSHPNCFGMDTIASLVIKEVETEKIVKTNSCDYFIIDQDATTEFFDDKVEITCDEMNKIFTYQGKRIDIGKGRGYHLNLEELNVNDSIHLSLFFENHSWYVQNNSSAFEIYINNIKMKPCIKYQLLRNYTINIDGKCNLVFFKSLEYKNIDELIGTVLDEKYEILRELGRGGVSTVYLAREIQLNKLWAVKEVGKNVSKTQKVVVDEILKEVDLMRKLDHSNIPRIVDFIEKENVYYIVMDYVEGQNLSELIKGFGPQNERMVVNLAKQLCDVLNYLHTQIPPIIYRDMKPSNIILQPNGVIKIIDFGIAMVYKPNQLDSIVLGTVGYAPPEQYEGKTDQRSDIYALGRTMCELLTGWDMTGISNSSEQQIELENVSKGLNYIINKCTEINPKKRYQNCIELLNDLENYKHLPRKSFLTKLLKK